MVLCMRAVRQPVSLCVIVGDSHQLTAHSTPPQSLPNSRSQEERWCGGCKTRGSADSSWILGRKPAAPMEWRQQIHGETLSTYSSANASLHMLKCVIIMCVYYSQLSMAIIKQTSVLHIAEILTFPCTVFLDI